jgi:hypothetical protein
MYFHKFLSAVPVMAVAALSVSCFSSKPALPETGARAVMASGTPLDTDVIERLTGLKGTTDSVEHAFRVSFPRNDLNITAAGVRTTSPMGLTSWAAFKRIGPQVIMMGDTVLREDQVSLVSWPSATI